MAAKASTWIFVVGFLGTLFACGSSKFIDIDWNPKALSQSKSNKVFFAHLGDTLYITCPYYQEESMWMVDYKDYVTCNATCDSYTYSAVCNTPGSATVKKLYVWDRHLHPGKKVTFLPASMHYFIGPSKGTRYSLVNRIGGHCRSHNLKVAVFVCDPKDISCGECSLPLGLEDGRMKADQISASLESDEKHKASYARLHSSSMCTLKQNSWCVSQSLNMKHYIQFDLEYIHLLSGIATQGSPHSPTWVTQYYLTYSFDGKHWTRHKSFDGNRDQDSIVHHWFKPRFHARLVRIYPEAWNGAICLRAEIYGCRVEGLSSSALQKPSTFVPHGHFKLQDEHRVLCGSHKCHPYATCKVKSGKPHCSCVPMSCNKANLPMCGSDGHTYANHCEMKKKACLKNKIIKVAKPGKCVHHESAFISDPETKKDDKLDISIIVVFSVLILLSVFGLIMFAVIVTRWIRERK